MTPLELRARRRARSTPRKIKAGEWVEAPPDLFGPSDRMVGLMVLGPLGVAVGFIVWILRGWV